MIAEARPVRNASPCWCGSVQWRLVFRTRRFGLILCASCGTFRIDPPPISDDREAPDFYTEYYTATEAPPSEPPIGRESRFWRVVRHVPELARPGNTVLDFGCGEGNLSAELRDAGWRSVVGVDVSRSRVTRARRRFPGIAFDDRGIGALPDYRGVFDLIVMDNVIEHLPRPLETLARLRECLVPGGALVTITPNMESGHFRLLGRRWTAELSPHSHIFLFTESSLRRAMTEAGLQIRAAGSFHLPYALAFALREFRRTHGVKDLVWRLGYEAAAFSGRLIRSGEMVYTVAGLPRSSGC